jgi:hypothetical protein
MSCVVLSYHVLPCLVLSFNVALCFVVLCCVVLCCILLRCVVLRCLVLTCVVLRAFVLRCLVLSSAVLSATRFVAVLHYLQTCKKETGKTLRGESIIAHLALVFSLVFSRFLFLFFLFPPAHFFRRVVTDTLSGRPVGRPGSTNYLSKKL